MGRFLRLKLQEYTVTSTDYWAKLTGKEVVASTPPQDSSSQGQSASTLWKLPPQKASEAYQQLLDDHSELSNKLLGQQERSAKLQLELQNSELTCHELRRLEEERKAWQARVADDGEAKDDGTQEEADDDECEPALLKDIAACEEALAAATERQYRPPVWAARCTWRDELDVRAGQLERISSQFDAAKRSLDAANEELQWQATRAEAMRMRLIDLQTAANAEDARTSELRLAHRKSLNAVEALLKLWDDAPSTNRTGLLADEVFEKTGADALQEGAMQQPLVVRQARHLLASTNSAEERRPNSPPSS